MQHVYIRCPNAHYFTGARCPWDGWGTPATAELVEVCRRLRDAGGEPSTSALAEAGIDVQLLDSCLIAEFGDEGFAFEAFWILGGAGVDAGRGGT
jgi:hypothetical protein